MKRIDVLKGIEKILVQKAYETGHISHRANGDWQKQADGSWIPYKGQSKGYTPSEDEEEAEARNVLDISPRQKLPEDDEEYGEITEEDLKETDIDQIDPSGYAGNISIDNGVADDDDLEDVANQILLDNNLEVNDENMNKARNIMLGWLDDNGYLDSDDEDTFSDEAYEQDNEDRENMSAQDTVEHLIDNGDYDESFKSIEFRKNDDGEDEPQDDSYFAVADTIMNDVSENYDFDEEDWEEGGDADNLYQYIVDRVIDKAYQFHTGDSSMGKAYSADEIDRVKNINQVDRHAVDNMETQFNKLVREDGLSEDEAISQMDQNAKDFTDKDRLAYEEFKKNVNKSKYRDMRSAPTTKNMGF